MRDSSVFIGKSTGYRVRLTRGQILIPSVGEALGKLLGISWTSCWYNERQHNIVVKKVDFRAHEPMCTCYVTLGKLFISVSYSFLIHEMEIIIMPTS